MEKIIIPQLVAKACQSIDLPVDFISQDQVLIKLQLPKREHLIVNFDLGLNTSSEARICRDKAYQIELLKEVIRIPKTKSYLDPQGEFGKMAQFHTQSEICADIQNNFSLPTIIKINQGSKGEGVFLCHNQSEIETAVGEIFSHQNWQYDYLLLAQEYIKPQAEYRAVFYRQHLEILYLKDNQSGEFIGNLSPLHFAGAKAVDLGDQELFAQITDFILPVFTKLPIKYAGFDIIKDHNDQWWLIEINSAPGFEYYLKHNSEEKVIKLLSKIFLDLKHDQ